MELTPNQRKYYEAAYMVLSGIVEDEVLDDNTTYNILSDAVKDIIEKQGLQNTLAIYVELVRIMTLAYINNEKEEKEIHNYDE